LEFGKIAFVNTNTTPFIDQLDGHSENKKSEELPSLFL